MACCGFCVTPIGAHSRHLHACCAGILRGRVQRTTPEHRLYVPSRTIKHERDLLASYDAEQKAKEPA